MNSPPRRSVQVRTDWERRYSAGKELDRSRSHTPETVEDGLGMTRTRCAVCGLPFARWREWKCGGKKP